MNYQQEIAEGYFFVFPVELQAFWECKAGHLVQIQVQQCIWHYINILASYSVFYCDLTPRIFDLYQSFKLQQ